MATEAAELHFAIHAEALPDGCMKLRLDGVLDGAGAYALRDRLVGLDTDAIVDFSRLERLSDFGLGIVAMGVSELPRDIRFIGLGNHAQRILRAFGINAAAA